MIALSDKKFSNYCDSCGKFSRQARKLCVYCISKVHSQDLEQFLCPDCVDELKGCLTWQDTTTYGGKWFCIWKQDKENIIKTMYQNMSSDLSAGYEYSEQSIQKQLADIREYENQYNEELEKFSKMTNGEVSRWCYYDLVKRDAIS